MRPEQEKSPMKTPRVNRLTIPPPVINITNNYYQTPPEKPPGKRRLMLIGPAIAGIGGFGKLAWWFVHDHLLGH
jgi:hypothetical protein